MNIEPIRDDEWVQRNIAYWNERAIAAKAETATLEDFNQRLLEIQAISKFLAPEDIVIDIGCGNGFSTQKFARQVKQIVGLDYAAQMIEQAKAQFPLSNGEYECGTVLDIPFNANSFSVAITERTLINLQNWEMQEQALREIFRVLCPGGRFIMCETTLQGLNKLNALRGQFGLSPIQVLWHNTPIDEERLTAWLTDNGLSKETMQRFSTFYLISRVVHPLMVAPDEPHWDHPINAVARRIAEAYPDLWDGASYMSVHVIHKPE